jgi:hypothetical protein
VRATWRGKKSICDLERQSHEHDAEVRDGLSVGDLHWHCQCIIIMIVLISLLAAGRQVELQQQQKDKDNRCASHGAAAAGVTVTVLCFDVFCVIDTGSNRVLGVIPRFALGITPGQTWGLPVYPPEMMMPLICPGRPYSYAGSKWGRSVVRRPRRAKSDCPTTGNRGALLGAALTFVGLE